MELGRPAAFAISTIVTAGAMAGLASPAAAAGPTRTVQTETVTLQQTLKDLPAFGPLVDCGDFVVLGEFTVTRSNLTFETRQVRHYDYTGRLYRVDPDTLEIGRSVAYEGHATRLASFPVGGNADEATTVKITGQPAIAISAEGRKVHLGTGLLSIDFSTTPPTFRSAGIDDRQAICPLLA